MTKRPLLLAHGLLALLCALSFVSASAGDSPAAPNKPLGLSESKHPMMSGMGQHPEVPPPQREGKVVVDPNAKFTHFRVGNKNVKSMYLEDKVLWVGTSGGLVRYDTRDDSFKLYDARNGLLSNGVFYVGRIKGQIAAGTYGGGLSLLDEKTGKWKTYNIPEGLGDAFVYEVMTAKNGDIWIATWSGANRVRGGALDDRSKWDLYTVENTKGGVPNDWIYGLAEGKNGDIWLATEGGMARFANNKWENWNHKRGLGADYDKVKSDIAFKNDPSKQSMHHAKQKQEMGLQGVDVAYNPNYVVSLEVDAQGTVWAGTWGGGLSRFDGTKWVSYTKADGLPGNHVFMLQRDPKGTLWIGTNSGLTQWQDGKFTKAMTTADGLFADNIFAMATGPSGDLWIGSYGGVAHLQPPARK
ncbi:ligand-binding sensor domain-containing protein [Denitratisoma oestradiolicum]|uniref:ligand-binding sensor domain-containing protein n=1 Tax=Denitratisoma oestradiolicum TaxID=311182 RepID=UPI0018D5F894|nr:two-component regulator propeller domain-containing protein [Denitratisoma oestradiolicum]